MAFASNLLAQAGGAATQKLQNYADTLKQQQIDAARTDAQAQQTERTRQFNATLANQKDEFGQDFGLRTNADVRAGNADVRAGHEDTRLEKLFPGALRQQGATYDATVAGTDATKEGTKGTAIANAWAPIMNTVLLATRREEERNMVGRTFKNEVDAQVKLAAMREQWNREDAITAKQTSEDLMRYGAAVNAALKTNPLGFQREALTATKNAGMEWSRLTVAKDKTTDPILSRDEIQRVDRLRQQIDSSPNPIQAVMQMQADFEKKASPESLATLAKVRNYLFSEAQAADLRRRLPGATDPVGGSPQVPRPSTPMPGGLPGVGPLYPGSPALAPGGGPNPTPFPGAPVTP